MVCNLFLFTDFRFVQFMVGHMYFVCTQKHSNTYIHFIGYDNIVARENMGSCAKLETAPVAPHIL